MAKKQSVSARQAEHCDRAERETRLATKLEALRGSSPGRFVELMLLLRKLSEIQHLRQ